jgi:hypothetical protein
LIQCYQHTIIKTKQTKVEVMLWSVINSLNLFVIVTANTQ